MTARRVHAVLAAGVHNPFLITQWQKSPQFLLSQGIDPASLDLATLRKFAGLTVKVRHNGLRRQFPVTFRYINLAGIEIDLFASYAIFCAASKRPYANTPTERARDLIAFLREWLDFDRPEHAILWDLIRHEQALALLATPRSPPSCASAGGGPVRSQDQTRGPSKPGILGEIVLHEMRCDPVVVEGLVFQRPPRLKEISLGCYYQCYWRMAPGEGIQIIGLDAFGYYLLSAVDGRRSTAELSSRLGGSRRPNRAFLGALNQLAAVGILEFGSTSIRGRA
jgi:hypothetical protein